MGKRGRPGVLRAQVREYLLRNPTAPDRDVITATHASRKTVYQARKELSSRGLIPLADRDRYNVKRLDRFPHGVLPGDSIPPRSEGFPTDPTALPEQGLGDLMKLVDVEAGKLGKEETELTPAEMKRILARLARHPNLAPQVRIAAIAQKARLDSEARDPHSLGPGPPLNREAALIRLTLLLEACGLDLAVAAMERAFHLEDKHGQTPVVEGPPVPRPEDCPPPEGCPPAPPSPEDGSGLHLDQRPPTPPQDSA